MTVPKISPPAAYLQYRELVTRAATIAQMPEGIIVGLVHTESRWNIHARSPAGAIGLGQFMPATAQDLARRYPKQLFPIEYTNPEWQFEAIGIYLKELHELHLKHKMYSVECNRYGSVLSSYNGGFKWAKKRWEMSGKNEDFWGVVRKINPGILQKNQQENELYPVKVYIAQSNYPVKHFCT